MSEGIEAKGYLKEILAHDEEIRMLVHQHILVLLGRIFLPSLLLLVILAGITFLEEQSFSAPEARYLTYSYAIALLPLLLIFWRYLVWANHCYVMTNRRVIQVKGVFDKEVADSVLDKLNDVKTDQTFLGRIFGYGDIEILTASEAGINALKFVSKPMAFKRAMLEAQEAQAQHA